MTAEPFPPLPADAPAWTRREDGVSSYTPELGAWICRRISEGVPASELCRRPDMPSKPTLHHWRKRHPEFAALYAQAREAAMAGRLSRDEDRRAGRRWMRARSQAAHPLRGLRGSAYTAGWAAAICERIAAGASLRTVAREAGMPGASTIYRWLREEPDFARMYALAREEQADAMMEEAREVARTATAATIQGARLYCQVLRWQIALLAPKKYGALLRAEVEEKPPLTVIVHRYEDPPEDGDDSQRVVMLQGPGVDYDPEGWR